MNLILDLQVHYTIDDDGIHLWCNVCLWEKTVGFSPTVAQVIDAAAEHPKLACKSPSTNG